ncbi:MAG: alpha/beta hydrolase [Myxococcota bacterium]
MNRTEQRHALQRDGETLVLRAWPRPDGADADTAIVFQHGLGEHGGRYATFVEHLDDLPVHFWAYDCRGHGESTGKRGHAPGGIPQLADDLRAVLSEVEARAGVSRIVLVGHSLGAVIAGWALTCGGPPPPSVVAVGLSAPPVKIATSLSVRLKTLLGRSLTRVAPALTLPSGIAPEGISSDPHEVARYVEDPLVHDRLSVRLGLSLLDDPPKIVAAAPALTLPVLLWHGTDDPIVDIAGSRELYAALGSEDKALWELSGYRHESHHERPDRVASLFERLRAWLQPHLT